MTAAEYGLGLQDMRLDVHALCRLGRVRYAADCVKPCSDLIGNRMCSPSVIVNDTRQKGYNICRSKSGAKGLGKRQKAYLQ